MPTEIYLVKVGMNMTEGVVEEWYVADGGTVEKGELLYRLETEKVNLDVDAEQSGTVKHTVAEGVTMKPGDVMGTSTRPARPFRMPPRPRPAEAQASSHNQPAADTPEQAVGTHLRRVTA
jgi:pyruvate/2-oxoglutarate dehydrogenase complex dihydrolipoamide acyltransferase (E2) component